MGQSWAWWVAFNICILAMLAIDLGVLHRKSHAVRLKEALAWSVVWTVVALLFNLGLWLGWLASYPADDLNRVAAEFLTGYLLERSLSMDNLFVFAVLFAFFAVPAVYQHRVLFYGILGALVLRAAFIFGGLWLIEKFSWMIYVFGAFLIFTGIKLSLAKGREVAPDKNPVLRLLRAVLPLSDNYIGGRFFARVGGRLLATPLLMVLLFLEVTDVVFALDSIPAIIGVTKDPFIVYTSNVLAILGLRALYFVLAAFIRLFRFLSYGLALLLVFIGVKMIVEHMWHRHLAAGYALGLVAVILTVAIAASLLIPEKLAQADPSDPDQASNT